MKMNKIRNERHTTLFTVPDGGSITIDGKAARVEYLDETHFNIIGSSGWKECYHIDQFGDLTGGRNVQPVSDDGLERFNYFLDEAHGGWVEVPLAVVREILACEKPSWRSRQKGDNAYLEDTRDTSLFRSAMERRGRTIIFVQVRETGKSQIRTYPSYGSTEADNE